MLIKMVYTSQPDVFFIRKKANNESEKDFLKRTIYNRRERKHLLAYQVWCDGELIKQARINH